MDRNITEEYINTYIFSSLGAVEVFIKKQNHYRKKGGKWNPVGTAEKRTVKDSATKAGFYRAYLLKAGLKAGTEVEVIAVARNTSGKIAASKIMKVKI